MKYSKSKHFFLTLYLGNDFDPFGSLIESLKRTFPKISFPEFL